MKQFVDKLKKHKFWADFFNKKSIGQFKRYLITGFTSFGIEYGLFALLTNYFKVYYLVANICIFTVVFWFNYFLNRRWSFKSTQSLKIQLPRYLLLFLFNLLMANIILMYLLTDIIGINKMFSKILIMGAVVSWNFILYKKVIYR